MLFDSDLLHYLALNEALKAYGERIGEEEHLSIFKGLPTLRKCEMLTAAGRLPESAHGDISRRKQVATRDAIERGIKPDSKVTALLLALKAAGWRQCCCSNSIRDTVLRVLLKIGLLDFMDFYLSNEDVARAKPFPDMFIKAANFYGIGADELVVVEDAEAGKRAALAAGCRLVAVSGPLEVGPELIHRLLAANKEAGHASAVH